MDRVPVALQSATENDIIQYESRSRVVVRVGVKVEGDVTQSRLRGVTQGPGTTPRTLVRSRRSHQHV